MSSRTSISSLLVGHRLKLSVIAAAAFLGGLCEAFFLVIITRAAFAISDGRDTFGAVANRDLTVGAVVLISTTLIVVRVAFALVASWASATMTANVTAQLRRDIGHAYLGADWPTQQGDGTGELQDLLTSFTTSVTTVVASVGGVLTAGLNLTAMLLLAVLVDPVAALILIAAVGLLALGIRPIRNGVRRASAESAKAGLAYSSAVSEISQMGLEINVFNTQDAVGRRIDELVDDRARADQRVGVRAGLVPTVYNALAYLAIVLALLVVAAADQADLRSVGAVMLVMLRSLSYGQAMQNGLTSIASSRPWAEEIGRRIDRYVLSARTSKAQPVSRVAVLELRGVDFSYDGEHPVLDDVSIRFEAGEIVGLAGPSGVGKSTLVQLLLGLRRPTRGVVLCDGQDIRELSHDDWTRRVTFVPQQSRLISGSVADNIRFYRSDVSDADIRDAARRAHLDDDVATWKLGLQHDVGSGGSHLSGGQQQRVCIARALVENPDVLILDEPTSALDDRSERAIREMLATLRGDVTVIIIAHRASTLEICDRVITLGRV